MSVTYRPDKPNETAELKKEVKTVKAAGESTAALLSLSCLVIVRLRVLGTIRVGILHQSYHKHPHVIAVTFEPSQLLL